MSAATVPAPAMPGEKIDKGIVKGPIVSLKKEVKKKQKTAVDELTAEEREAVTIVFHQFETGLREGTIFTKVSRDRLTRILRLSYLRMEYHITIFHSQHTIPTFSHRMVHRPRLPFLPLSTIIISRTLILWRIKSEAIPDIHIHK